MTTKWASSMNLAALIRLYQKLTFTRLRDMATTAAPNVILSKRATLLHATGKHADLYGKGAEFPVDPSNESVYELIPKEYVAPPKNARHRSLYANQARGEHNSGRKQAASMGPAKVQVNDTSDFLKKGDGLKKIVSVRPSRPDRTVRKAPVPKEKEDPIPPSKKDFVKQNALDNINSMARKNEKAVPCYTAKKDYGRAPDYLKRRNTELKEREFHQAQAMAETKSSRGAHDGIVQLPDEERAKILDGLQANWMKLNSDYQRLSLTVDTVPKISRKVNMEQQLKQYEELIERFSHTNIHVNFNALYN
ncbi:hypothetical protein BDV3_001253 [Batrachochytrium dendrobatidis]